MNNQTDILRNALAWQTERTRQLRRAAEFVLAKFAEIDDESWPTEGVRVAIGELNQAIADVEGDKQ